MSSAACSWSRAISLPWPPASSGCCATLSCANTSPKKVERSSRNASTGDITLPNSKLFCLLPQERKLSTRYQIGPKPLPFMTRIAYVSADLGVPIFGRKGCSIHAQEILGALLHRGAEVALFSTRAERPPTAGLEPL